MHNASTNITEQVLRIVNPATGWLGKHFPGRFLPPAEKPPHPSAMLAKRNWVYNSLLPRFFTRISIDLDALSELKQKASGATLVYISKQSGHLEYNYFNHIFAAEGLPLAAYNNFLTMRRWMKWDDWWNSVLSQEAEITKNGKTFDPLEAHTLNKMISSGDSAFIKIPGSTLIDEGLFATGPIAALVEIVKAQRESRRPILLVPLDFIWTRRPAKGTKSLVDVLFGEKENPGTIRKLAMFCRNYKTEAHAAIGSPIDLSKFVAGGNGKSDAEIAELLRKELLSVLKAKRHTVTGPMQKPRSWFINEVLGDEFLDERICAIATERGKLADDMRELARRYIKEIAADVDHTYIELMEKLVKSTVGKIYDNFDVDAKGLRKAKELYEQGPIVFVPNHKSHVDYLVLSYILHKNNMTTPYIAAGMNLGFWPLGKVFRKCGAYFIRRQFRDNPLYRAVLETYLKVLIEEGYSQEFFIEGGRSRTGKLRQPKHGMIAMLGSAAARAGKDRLHFIPVCLTYDRVIEQKSLVQEGEGGTKASERPSQLLRLIKFLTPRRHRQGSLYIKFGEPVAMECRNADPASVAGTADAICHEINRNAVVTPIALAASALLVVGKRGVTMKEFDERASQIMQYLNFRGAPMAWRLASTYAEAVQKALSQLSIMRLAPIPEGAIEPYAFVDDAKRTPLAFFKNGIVHYMLTLGSVCSVLLSEAAYGRRTSIEHLSAEFETMKELVSHEFKFASSDSTQTHIDRALSFLVEQGACVRSGNELAVVDAGKPMICMFEDIIRPYIETLYVSLLHVKRQRLQKIEEKDLIADIRKAGNDLWLLGRVRFREAVNKFDIQNTLVTLASHGILEQCPQEEGKRRKNVYLVRDNDAAVKNLQVKLEKIL